MSLLAALDRASKAKAKAPADWQRIRDLPRRAYTAEELQALAAEYTARLKRPSGSMVLRPVQALALHEAARGEAAGGILGFIPTGAGKSLIGLLLPMVVPECRVAVLLVPPQLKTKTVTADYPRLSAHWRLPSLGDDVFNPGAPKVYPVSYAELSSPKKGDVLERLKPDLIIADEAHSVVNASARTRRLFRYLKANPSTRFCPMSGTLITRSVKDISTLARGALRYGTPLPLDFLSLEAWAEALDPQDEDAWRETHWRVEQAQTEIIKACPVEGPDEKSATLRERFHRRVVETPGVVAFTPKRDCQAGLEFHQRPLKLDDATKTALSALRSEWRVGTEEAGFEELEDAVALSRAARQLAAGLFTRWVWPRKEPLALRREWLARRADWHREVRNALTYSPKAGMDSPMLLAQAAAAGRWVSVSYGPWKEIEDACVPETDVVWVSNYLVKDAAAWGKKHVGLIWTSHLALGPAIAKELGCPYFGSRDDAEALLAEARRADRSIVLSANAFGTGFDLERYSEQLVTTPSSNPSKWQQLLARTHRTGQKADTITTYVYTHTPELTAALSDALEGARFLQEVTQEEQLLLMATHAWR